MAFFAPAFRYDPSFRASSHGANWRREGQTVIFGPEYAAAVLNQEKSHVRSGVDTRAAAQAEWVVGLSAKELREQFPSAVHDAQQFVMTEAEMERRRANPPSARR